MKIGSPALCRTTTGRKTLRLLLGLGVPALVLGVAAPVTAQFAGVENAGSGAANSGGNACVGNASTNSLGGQQITQGGLIGLGLTLGGPVNYSDGSCEINTGDAAASGNAAQTSVAQRGRGFPFSFGTAGVSNSGEAAANTGNNACVGNASSNSLGGQQVTQGGLIGLGLTLGGPVNYSSGSCEITTGDAAATGNTSQTDVYQGGKSGFPFHFRPAAGVSNTGSAAANSGNNACVGNASTNTFATPQVTQGGLIGLGLTLGGPVNYSDGSCQITTGDAAATGNVAQTAVYQGAAGGGAPHHGFPFFFGPFAAVVNEGAAEANTGNNFAIGNMSETTAGGQQFVSGSLLGLGLVAGGPTNFSQGSAVIDTGDAAATGNTSGTQVQQSYQWQW